MLKHSEPPLQVTARGKRALLHRLKLLLRHKSDLEFISGDDALMDEQKKYSIKKLSRSSNRIWNLVCNLSGEIKNTPWSDFSRRNTEMINTMHQYHGIINVILLWNTHTRILP